MNMNTVNTMKTMMVNTVVAVVHYNTAITLGGNVA